MLIIADDVINDKNARNNGSFNKMFTQGRHYRIDTFVISQTLKGFHPTARSNSDLIITWRMLKYDDRLCICEDFLSISDGTKKECMKAAAQLMNSISEMQYRAMVVAVYKSAYARELHEYVYHYIANPKLEPTMIGKGAKHKKSLSATFKYVDDKDKEQVLNLRISLSGKKKYKRIV